MSPQFAIMVGPGKEPFTVRTSLETPSSAAVVLVSSNQYCETVNYMNRKCGIKQKVESLMNQDVLTSTVAPVSGTSL